MTLTLSEELVHPLQRVLLAQRIRIAQELHDTLLQGFVSASMQLHAAVERLPLGSPSKPPLSRILQLMTQVIEEGRKAVLHLRSSSDDNLDLEHSFSEIRHELGFQQQIALRVIVAGRHRALHKTVRDEIYRIGREALVNAFRHADARSIEVEIEYTAKRLRVVVRDDGHGIDARVLQSGRAEHWGLLGMRERSDRIGAKLSIRSRRSAGTEVELSVPGRIAFDRQKAPRP